METLGSLQEQSKLHKESLLGNAALSTEQLNELNEYDNKIIKGAISAKKIDENWRKEAK